MATRRSTNGANPPTAKTLPLPGTIPEPIAVREELVEVLRRDLVGPGPGTDHPLAFEVLPMSPERWYLTGFLIPFQAPEEVRSELDSDEESNALGDDEDEEEGTPEQRSARRAYFPSSLGVSVLVGASAKRVRVEVTWGDYEPEETKGAPSEEEGSAQGRRDTRWKRSPREGACVLELEALPSRIEVPGSEGLYLVPLLRVVPPGTHPKLKSARALSVFLVNDRALTQERAASFAFQARLALTCDEGFLPRPSARAGRALDVDEQIAELQFRDDCEFAVGHGTATHVTPHEGGCVRVETTWLPTEQVHKVIPGNVPGVTRSMEALATAEGAAQLVAMLQAMPVAYEAWLNEQARTLVGQEHQAALELLISEARITCRRIAEGIKLLGAVDDVREAFQLANKVMARQSRQRMPGQEPTWHTFQLAFVLMNLRGMHDPTHAERREVDLLFFPTGGGKTEAYLGLAAFALVLRRLRNPGVAGAGVSVVMRYTLRLLTLDQLGRAAALICALELERKDNARLGTWPFEIGLWVGRSATPNRLGKVGDEDPNSARKVTKEYLQQANRRKPLPLEECPWCHHPLGQASFRLAPDDRAPTNLEVRCLNPSCEFSGEDSLPLVGVDEVLYRRLPCFLIATVDKFAQLPWVGATGALFGKVTHRTEAGFFGPHDAVPDKAKALPGGLPPPDLIIQDELHLISGPLGTMVGLYETAIDALCERRQGEQVLSPKVVASTATVRRAEAQIRALFGRPGVRVFPPPGPDRLDSFFARTVPPSERNARRYVGVAAPGRGLKVAFLRVTLALLGAGQRRYEQVGGKALAGKNPVDPYMTQLTYFSNLRELGGTRRIVEDEVRSRSRAYQTRARVGVESDFVTRAVKEPVELTSREPTATVAVSKDRLGRPASDGARIDLALATNMISVGLDITRLGLMVVYGQPKTTSEYIQATSRVGRDDRRPGLVVTLLNVHKPRDRSHYERFGYYHQTFYRSVEATSVTPFSPRALDRGLAAVTVAMARLGHGAMTPALGAMQVAAQRKKLDAIALQIAERAANHDGALLSDEQVSLGDDTRARVQGLLDSWEGRVKDALEHGAKMQYQREISGPPPLLRDPLDPALAHDPEARKFKAQRSLRDVEPSVLLKLKTLSGQPIEE